MSTPILGVDQDIIAALRAARSSLYAFKRAFPDIPLDKLVPASTWHRLEGGDLSDDALDALLGPWLRTADPGR